VVALIVAAANASAQEDPRPPADEWPGWPGPCVRLVGMPLSANARIALDLEPERDE
jgi:hypothetical protein